MIENRNLLKRLLYFIVNSQIYIAVGSISIIYASTVLLSTPFSLELGFIAFASSFAIYNINRRTDMEEDKINTPHRLDFIRQYDMVLYVSIIFYIVALLLSFFIDYRIFLLLLAPILIGVTYSYGGIPKPIQEAIGYRRLKEIPLIKNFVVSIVWALPPLIVAFYYALEPDALVLSVMIYVFLRIFMGCVAFDIRDVRGDDANNIKTIPVLFGVRASQILLYTLNTLSALFLFFVLTYFNFPPQAHVINLATIYAYYYIYRLGKDGRSLLPLCDFVVDGEYLLIGVLAWLSTLA